MKLFIWPWMWIALLLQAADVQGQASAPAVVVVADFEAGSTTELVAKGLDIAIVSESDPSRRFLQLKPAASSREFAPGRSYIRLSVPKDAQAQDHAALRADLRAQATRPIDVTWLALDDRSRPLFHRRFQLSPDDRWVRIEQPLRNFRWDVERVGDWDEVRELALRIDSPGTTQIDLDEVRFEGTETLDQRVQWLLSVAFEDRNREFIHEDGLLVATDAVDVFDESVLRRLLDNMRRTRAFVRRVFGDAVLSTDDHGAPAALIIFADAMEYPSFFKRLGEQWNVAVAAPTSQGMTVQDMAASTYDAKAGTNRPVYLHESVHAVVARDLRLLTGHAPHRPLHEGLAAYVQLCVYPESIDRKAFAAQFSLPIDPDGKGFFRPLKLLFEEPVSTRHYAQLASVVAYLVESDPDLLRALASGLADGASASDVLAKHGTTWSALQNAWYAWGRERFANSKPAPRGAPLFELPKEFR